MATERMRKPSPPRVRCFFVQRAHQGAHTCPALQPQKAAPFFVHLGFFFGLRGSAEFVNGSFDRRGFSQARRGRSALKSGLIPGSFRGAQMEASRQWVYLIRRGGGGGASGRLGMYRMMTCARSREVLPFAKKSKMILHRVVSLSHANTCVCVCFRHFGSDRVLVTHHRRDLDTPDTQHPRVPVPHPLVLTRCMCRTTLTTALPVRFCFVFSPRHDPCVFHLDTISAVRRWVEYCLAGWPWDRFFFFSSAHERTACECSSMTVSTTSSATLRKAPTG